MLVTLKNEKITMVVSTLGAEPQSLVFEGREYLWNGDKEYWFRRAPLLFPMIGPTKDDKIGYQGKEYKMPNNGFARDTEFSLVSQNDREAVFILEDSQETRENNYPFGFILKVTYSLLENGYKAKAEITADMMLRAVDSLEAGGFLVRFTKIITNRLDSRALKADLPEIAAKYMKQGESYRFSIA